MSANSSLDEVLDHWDNEPADVALELIEQYGEPDAVTPQRLRWDNIGPWKRTVLRPDGANHEFPAPHLDYLEQVIDYHVPAERADEVLAFDGSVTIRRTRGELSAESQDESENFLAINLVHEILTDEKTVEEAREAYTERYVRRERGDTPDSCTGFQFDLPGGDQTDPDSQAISSKDEHDLDNPSVRQSRSDENPSEADQQRQEAEAAADEEAAKHEISEESASRERQAEASGNPDAHRDKEPFSSE